MGFFDQVFVDKDLADEKSLKCKKCNKTIYEFQTKSLGSCMNDFSLKRDELDKKITRLYRLDISKKENTSIEDRNKRFLGEYPHQWINIYEYCDNCKILTDFYLKFTDGILKKVSTVPPIEFDGYEF